MWHLFVRYKQWKNSWYLAWALNTVCVWHKVSSVRPFSPGKLLDVDDQYYRALPTSRSAPSMSTEETSPPSSMPERRQSAERRRSAERRQSVERRRSMDRRQRGDRRQPAEKRQAAASRQSRERAVSEPEPPKPAKDNRYVQARTFFIWKRNVHICKDCWPGLRNGL